MVEAAEEKKAQDIAVLDLRGVCDFTDFFVISHGDSTRQVLTVAEAVEERLAATFGLRPNHVEGRRSGEWVLLDYIDFVVHSFLAEKRAFYRLERLWGDAPRLDLTSMKSGAAAGAVDPRKRQPTARR